MKRPVRHLLVAGVLLGAVLGIRTLLSPRESPAPQVKTSDAVRERISSAVNSSRVDQSRVVRDLSSCEILLVGEEHYYRETNEFLTSLLDRSPGRRIALLLEIPAAMQQEVDEYVAAGTSHGFDAAVDAGSVLPYGHILRWAHRNRSRLSAVTAMDENRSTIIFNRAFLRDTRNATMAKAILHARNAHRNDLVVAYGGQMHMMLGGRYRYDVSNRTPAGALLLKSGIKRTAIRSVMLSGRTKAPICDIASSGIVSTSSIVGDIPYAYFIDYPIFRVTRARDLFDYFVNLGQMTRVK